MTVKAPRHLLMNTLYFLLIGWWLGFVWATIGILLCCTVILWPAGTAMVLKTPDIMFGT